MSGDGSTAPDAGGSDREPASFAAGGCMQTPDHGDHGDHPISS